MNIHEYQAKELFGQYGLPVPSGQIAETPEDVKEAVKQLGLPVVVKAQILAGGRGNAGGVKFVATMPEAVETAKNLLGKILVTRQTGPAGQQVRRLLVEKGLSFKREFYAAITLDRSTSWPVLIVSKSGGMDIEEVAAATPENILKISIDPRYGLTTFQARKAAAALGLSGKTLHACARLLLALYRLYDEKDATLAEINPLVLTEDERLVALDAKLNLDENALFRHPEFAALKNDGEKDDFERLAGEHGLNYIRLNGNIGVMVNGAGLAMATMDLIKQAGREPANFLDVGGGAKAEKIASAFRIILGDSNVKAILINIFGGILRCDLLAEGIVKAARDTGIAVPMIIRMQGTHAETGRNILAESGLSFSVAEDLEDASRLVSEVGQ